MATFDIAADEIPTRDELLRWLEAPIVKRLGALSMGMWLRTRFSSYVAAVKR
jgi:hypothetical protein